MNSESGARAAHEPDGAGEHPARLRVGIIGPGRVGAALGVALNRAGHEVTAVAAVSDTSVRRARDLLPAARITEPAEVIAATDLVLLTVPDDALPGLVSGLAATGAALGGRLLAHTSGRYGTGVLEPATRLGRFSDPIVSPTVVTAATSMAFSSSRILPGQW